MRLSEAIALGQGLVGNWEAGLLGKCALGMACKSIGIEISSEGENRDYDAIRERWPWLREDIDFPFRMRADGSVIAREALEVIYETFDHEVMCGEVTFEQFLDWVRSIEPDDTPSLPDAVAADVIGAELVQKDAK